MESWTSLERVLNESWTSLERVWNWVWNGFWNWASQETERGFGIRGSFWNWTNLERRSESWTASLDRSERERLLVGKSLRLWWWDLLFKERGISWRVTRSFVCVTLCFSLSLSYFVSVVWEWDWTNGLANCACGHFGAPGEFSQFEWNNIYYLKWPCTALY